MRILLVVLIGLLVGCTRNVGDYAAADMGFFGDNTELPAGAKPVATKTGAVTGTPAQQAHELQRYLTALEEEKKQVVLAVARVQGPEFDVPGTQVWGRGNYRVVTGKGAERPVDVEKLGKLPGVKRAVQITELNIPVTLVNDGELRLAGRELGADLLLVYTISSKVTQNTDKAPDAAQASARSVAQGVLLETKTGRVLMQPSREVRLASAPLMPVTPDVDIGLIEQSQRLAFAGMVEAAERGFVVEVSGK
jgi:hypothetical protein